MTSIDEGSQKTPSDSLTITNASGSGGGKEQQSDHGDRPVEPPGTLPQPGGAVNAAAAAATAAGPKAEEEEEEKEKATTSLPPLNPAIEAVDAVIPQTEDALAKALKFLSTASPETLGGIGVGLAAATYLVLGKLGLVLIGAFGGVVLYISIEARHPELSRAVRSERGVAVLQRLGLDRVPEESKKSAEGEGEAAAKKEEERLISCFDDFRPQTREALGGLVDAIIRDYIKWWYSPILPADSSFPLSCRKVLNSFILSVSNAMYRKRPADAFLDFLTNASSIVIVFLSELSTAYADLPAESNPCAADVVYNYLADNPDSSLANLLSQPQQASKFRMVAEDLLHYLDRSSHGCDPARIFLREIIAGIILEMSLQSCSKPEWINGWIVHLLEAGEPDFSQAIDVGMQTGPDANNAIMNANANPSANAWIDIDGNVGNIGLVRGNRNSFELEKAARRKDPTMAHKKKLSRADEEMEVVAMEEVKRMNAMLAEAEKRKSNEGASSTIRETTEPTEQSNGPPQTQEDRASSETQQSQRTNSASGHASSPRSQGSMDKSMAAAAAADGSVRDESLHSPITPRSTTTNLDSRDSSPKKALANGDAAAAGFTNFDQIVPPAKEEPEASGEEGPRKPMLTLHNATISLHDDAANESARIRSKPTWEYLVQIEPTSSHHAGWMIIRCYSDFETLHEILRRIATISGATAFTEQHAALPNWKVHTRGSLRGELERYIRDACWFQSLAESEGMKRFLEKENARSRGESKSGLDWESVSKNMVDVLSLGSKGAMEGSKAVFGGVTGVFNNINIGLGPRRQTNHSTSLMSEIQTQPQAQTQANRLSLGSLPRMDSSTSLSGGGPAPAISPGGPRKPRDSLDSQRSSVVSVQPGKMAPMERRPSYDSRGEPETDSLKPRPDRWDRNSPSAFASRDHSRASSLAALRSPLRSPSTLSLDGTKLMMSPAEETHGFHDSSPVHGEMQNKAAAAAAAAAMTTPEGTTFSRQNSTTNIPTSPAGQTPQQSQQSQQSQQQPQAQVQGHAKKGSVAGYPTGPNGPNGSPNGNGNGNGTAAGSGNSTTTKANRQYSHLSEQETRVAVELVFAIINEMYTLSSAWNIRRTLLTAAKSFLLRPGNPSLISIQKMMQESVIESNTDDGGLAHHLRKLRENTMPTEDERAAWPAEMTAEEKEKLRVKARRMLIERGVPAALTGVMGQAATTDALGRIFDCLQIEEVARGLMFGIMLQAVRVVTH